MTPGGAWRFDPDELVVLAELLRLDQWPFPFSVRPTALTREAHRARTSAARQRLHRSDLVRGDRVEPDLENAVLALARPHWSIDACGFHGDAPASLVRVLGASSGRAGVVGMQVPGLDEQTGGSLDLRVVSPSTVCEQLARALPVVVPGREPPARVPTAHLRTRPSDTVTWPAHPGPTERDRARLVRLTAEPFAGAGQIGVTASARNGPIVRRCGLRWIDRPHDGRYLLSTPGETLLQPADVDVLTRALADELRLALAGR